MRRAAVDEVLLVLDAYRRAETGLAQARVVSPMWSISTGAVLTKLDGTAKGRHRFSGSSQELGVPGQAGRAGRGTRRPSRRSNTAAFVDALLWLILAATRPARPASAALCDRGGLNSNLQRDVTPAKTCQRRFFVTTSCARFWFRPQGVCLSACSRPTGGDSE